LGVLVRFLQAVRDFKMRVKDILEEKGSDVFTIDGGETIHAAVVLLNQHGFGALVVTGEEGHIAGIVTERDILQCCGDNCTHLKNAPPKEQALCPVLVSDIMTKDLVIGVPGDDLNYVMGVMTRHRIRHLPILDDGKLAGIISLGDLINAHFEENVFESRTLKEYVHRRGHSL
jgi:CBS domain-containing protein